MFPAFVFFCAGPNRELGWKVSRRARRNAWVVFYTKARYDALGISFCKAKEEKWDRNNKGGGSLEDEEGRDRSNRYIDRKMGERRIFFFAYPVLVDRQIRHRWWSCTEGGKKEGKVVVMDDMLTNARLGCLDSPLVQRLWRALLFYSWQGDIFISLFESPRIWFAINKLVDAYTLWVVLVSFLTNIDFCLSLSSNCQTHRPPVPNPLRVIESFSHP